MVGMEWVFFKAACMVLHFGFVMKTLLITQKCFSYCWKVLAQCHIKSCSAIKPKSGFSKADTVQTSWRLVCLWEVVRIAFASPDFFFFLTIKKVLIVTHKAFLALPLLIIPFVLLGRQWVTDWLGGILTTTWDHPITIFS